MCQQIGGNKHCYSPVCTRTDRRGFVLERKPGWTIQKNKKYIQPDCC